MNVRGEVEYRHTRGEQLEHVKISNKLFTFGKRFVGWGVVDGSDTLGDRASAETTADFYAIAP